MRREQEGGEKAQEESKDKNVKNLVGFKKNTINHSNIFRDVSRGAFCKESDFVLVFENNRVVCKSSRGYFFYSDKPKIKKTDINNNKNKIE